MAERAIDSYLDALLTELPEEAVEAMRGELAERLKIGLTSLQCDIAIRAFLQQLRSGEGT